MVTNLKGVTPKSVYMQHFKWGEPLKIQWNLA